MAMAILSQAAQTTMGSLVASGDSSGLIASLTATAPMEAHSDGWYSGDPTTAEAAIAAWNGSVAQLAYWQGVRLAQLEAQRGTVIDAGFAYSVTGGTDSTQHTYQIDEVAPTVDGTPLRQSSQAAISHAQQWAAQVEASVANTPAWPSGFIWVDSDNNLVPMTSAQFAAFAGAVAVYVAAIDANYYALRAQINAATTMTAVQSVDPAAGWPT